MNVYHANFLDGEATIIDRDVILGHREEVLRRVRQEGSFKDIIVPYGLDFAFRYEPVPKPNQQRRGLFRF